MASKFLEDLKNAVDKGEFNSDAAKKINEIDNLADNPKRSNALWDAIEKASANGDIKTLSEEERAKLQTDYEKQMDAIKKNDIANAQLATLIDIENMVQLSIKDMLDFIDELEDKFHNEFASEDPAYGQLSLKMEEIQSKYSSIINK